MQIHLLRSTDVPPQLHREVYELLDLSQGPLNVRRANAAVELPDEILSWQLFFAQCMLFRQENNVLPEDFVVLLTTRKNDKNWFSAYDSNGSNSVFICTDDWEYYVPSEAKYPIAYEVIVNVLQKMTFSDIEETVQHAHMTPRGCMNDMCEWKSEITFKLRTADICEDCLQLLNGQGVRSDVIQQVLVIFDTIRREVLFSRLYHAQREDDSLLPFSVAITRRKMNTAVEPLGKFLMMLDHFDSLIRTSVLMLGGVMLGSEFIGFNQTQRLDDRPSLGHWTSAFRELSRLQRADTGRAVDVPSDFFDRLSTISGYTEREQIVHLRNERRGHGYVDQYDKTYQQAFEQYKPVLQEIERVLFPILAQYQLQHIHSSNRIDEASFRIKGKALMGSHPDFAEEEIVFQPREVNDLPVVERVYAYGRLTQRWYTLHPFIVYHECPECGHLRLLISDGSRYLDPYVGHRVQI